MKITYLVLAHNQPDQLQQLLKALLPTSTEHNALVHVDSTVDERPFREAIARFGGRVKLLPKRSDSRWGGFGMVQAEIDLLKSAIAGDGDFFVLLSGADYPIKSIAALSDELASGCVYMTAWPMPAAEHGKPMKRLNRLYLAGPNRNNLAYAFMNKLVFQILPKRDVDRGLQGCKPFGGTSWWAMPRTCAEATLRFIDDHPRLVTFFRRARNPDEMFIHTVVHALDGGWTMRPALTFADWTRTTNGGSGPATLTEEDVDNLSTRPEYFARKFNTRSNPDVLRVIDDRLL